jgi:ATP-binding cassette, subfamily B, multidrug efflux pump
MLRWLENAVPPTGTPIPVEPPPNRLLGFYWYFLRQAKWPFAALFVAGLAVALVDVSIPWLIGRIVGLVAETAPQTLFRDHWTLLLGMGALVLIGRPLAVIAQHAVTNQAINANVTNLIRWQNHWHVVRQSWSFFQNDFAGRIATRVMQTGPALRESVVATIQAIWYIAVYGVSAVLLTASADAWLSVPILGWFVLYIALLRWFVPRLRDRSKIVSEARSHLTGRIVDSYTNILTVKLFARAADEDAFVRESLDEHLGKFHASLRYQTALIACLGVLNATLVVGSGVLALVLWSRGAIGIETVAMVLPLTWQIVNVSGWVAFQVSSIFENVGVVQEGMLTIAQPQQMADRPDARPLHVSAGNIRFEDVHFGYGTSRGVLHGLSLDIRPGEKIGLVGHSGAGKSTLINLLLRFFEPQQGRIVIDGQNIAACTQESVRAQIAVVTQDTSLLHRSIGDNIRYGRPDADREAVERAAARAEAAEFIPQLEDNFGRTGYVAHVGERGVKLSGGQRQRIAIARVILKDAPILVLDEATSALDSEVEAAIQTSLTDLMTGKTVIAIAHRLSTIAQMDRLVVLDHGRIVEEGSHAELLARGGRYAALWRRQSGGFLQERPASEAAE